MTGQKFMPHGTQLTVNSVTVGGLTSLSLPKRSRGEAETTDTDSAWVREWVAGLVDNGELGAQWRVIPGDAGQDEVRDNMGVADAVVEVVVTFPAQATTDSEVVTVTFDAFAKNLDEGELDLVGDVAAGGGAAFRVSGAISVVMT